MNSNITFTSLSLLKRFCKYLDIRMNSKKTHGHTCSIDFFVIKRRDSQNVGSGRVDQK